MNHNDNKPATPVIDIEESLKRLQSNKELFISLLTSFSEDYADAVDRIVVCVEANEYEEAGRIAHTIKSLSGTFCAYELRDIAGRLEKELKNRKYDKTTIASFQNKLEPVLKAAIEYGATHYATQAFVNSSANNKETENKPTLLVVDDSDREQMILQSTFLDDYQIILASSGEEAIEITKHQATKIDLILLDLNLPGLDGIETCKQLKQITHYFETPIVIVTASNTIDSEQQGFEAGAVDYISKPISIPILRARVRNHIELKSYRQSLKSTIESRTKTLSRALVELTRSGSVKDEFLSTISHELRTPINGIAGSLDLLRQQLDKSSDEHNELLSTAIDSTNHLKRMIETLLLFSEAKSGRLVINTVVGQLDTIGHHIKEKYTSLCAAKQLCLQIEMIHSAENSFIADTAKIDLIIDQLMDNAVKFTENGTISVIISLPTDDAGNSTLDISIKDTGIGIPAEILNKMTDHFHQADGSFSRRYAGLGIGLGVCQHLSNALGAQFQIQSSKAGTQCHIVIPVAETLPVTPHYSQRDVMATKEVLVVEDNRVNQIVISKMLEKMGFHVTTADNGHKAIPILQQQQFALIFMDCQMPVMDGFETTRYIRSSDGGNSNIPVIAVTANAMSGDKERCMASGMDDYLTKPVDSVLLGRVIEKWSSKCIQLNNTSAVRPKILLVEDNDQLRNLTGVYLKKAEVDFDVAINGQEAVDKALQYQYSLILMDIEMPVMNGVDAFLKLKTNNYAAPVYALTANSDDAEAVNSYLKAGFSGVLAKPIESVKLLEIMRSI